MSIDDKDDYEDTGTFPGCDCCSAFPFTVCGCRRRHFQAEAKNLAEKLATQSEAKPFRHGDVCEYKGESHWKGRHIIDEISVDDDPERWEYATSRGAWIPHEAFDLVAESSVKSRAELHQMKVDDRERGYLGE